MGDSECLVEIEIGKVPTIIPWGAETHLGIHIGSTHIDLYTERKNFVEL